MGTTTSSCVWSWRSRALSALEGSIELRTCVTEKYASAWGALVYSTTSVAVQPCLC